MSLWKPARNAPPPSADDLRANAEPIRAEIAALKANVRNIPAELANLAGDAVEFARAQAALRDGQALLPIKEAALASIEAAIPAAENRARLERLRADRGALKSRTAKLKRNLQERYDRAAKDFAEVLREMEANTDEWHRMNLTGRPLGERDGEGAELELRREVGMRPGGGGMPGSWASLCDDIEVRDWHGRLIFGGPAGSY